MRKLLEGATRDVDQDEHQEPEQDQSQTEEGEGLDPLARPRERQ
jgi:hypothetical protein